MNYRIILRNGLLCGLLFAVSFLVMFLYKRQLISLDILLMLYAAEFVGLGLLLGKYVYNKQQQSYFSEDIKANFDTDVLSERELEILELIAKGYSNKEIAGNLFLSPNTIKTHISNLYSKLGVSRRTQAVLRGKELQLLS